VLPIQAKLYLASLGIYHFAEYMFVACFHHHKLEWDSFLINQSKAYGAAMAIAWVEFILEYLIFGGKCSSMLSQLSMWMGVVITICGQYLRIAALFTAASNFNHMVQHKKDPDHVLVTHGVYSWARHPSYLGWFMWSVGMQVIVFNPISTVGFTWAAWTFFYERIPDEELALHKFFGKEYEKYCERTPIIIPGLDKESPFKFKAYLK